MTALKRHSESAFKFLCNSGDDQALINCCAVDHEVFCEPLQLFQPVFDSHAIDWEPGLIEKLTHLNEFVLLCLSLSLAAAQWALLLTVKDGVTVLEALAASETSGPLKGSRLGFALLLPNSTSSRLNSSPMSPAVALLPIRHLTCLASLTSPGQ